MATPKKRLSNENGDSVMYKQASGFVYYNRLASDAQAISSSDPVSAQLYSTLYSHATASLSTASAFAKAKMPQVASSLKAQTNNELSKELAVLKKVWKVTFTPEEISSPNFYKDLIEAYNTVIQTKQVYEREMARIKYRGKKEDEQEEDKLLSKIDVTSVFGSYFEKVWRSEGRNALMGAIQSSVKEMRALDKAEFSKIMDAQLLPILNKALIEMLRSQAFDSRWKSEEAIAANKAWNNPDKKNPYIALAERLEAQGTSLKDNKVLANIWRMINFQSLKQELYDELKELDWNRKNPTNKKILEKSILGTARSARVSGNLAEIIWRKLAGVTMNKVGVKATRTGDLNNQKADLILTYNMDTKALMDKEKEILKSEEVKKKAESSVRMQNILTSSKLVELLEGDGGIAGEGFNFIAYVNAKNYTLGNTFRGFHGETGLSMSNLKSILGQDASISSRGADALISQLIQFTKGAVGDKQDPHPILDSLAEVVASFLFDDYSTLCSGLASNGHNAIHFFLLDGVYVPLSFFLNKISTAIEMCAADTSSFFRFSLQTGTIKYGSLPLEDFQPGMWAEQRESAMSETSLSLTFLRNFQSLMSAL